MAKFYILLVSCHLHKPTSQQKFYLSYCSRFFFSCPSVEKFDQWFLVFANNFPIFYITKKAKINKM